MKISNPFNRFFHGVVYKEVHSITTPLKVFNGKFVFRPHGLTFDSCKQLLKHLDLDFPRDNEKVQSITKLDSKQMMKHYEFIIKMLANNGITMPHIEEEWKRLMRSVRNV